VITNWDELEGSRRERGHIAATWTPLSGPNSITVGVNRVRIEPAMWSTPLHLEGSEEEIFYVLAGSGRSVQSERGGLEAYEVGPGDCLVHLALEHAHTLQAGPDGLDVLVFGERHYAANTLLPNAGVSWLGPTWVLAGAEEDHPWAREAAAGPPEVDQISPRPRRVVNVGDVEARTLERGDVGCEFRDLGRAAGSERTGIKHITIAPGKLASPPHCHSADEELFVVLEGTGTLELFPSARGSQGLATAAESHPLRAGSTVARPAATRVAHAFRADADGLTLLAYGTRERNDIAYYPRSRKLYLRGVGVVARVEPLDYWDGED
jgi:uncharacterized cupin superfamily protein